MKHCGLQRHSSLQSTRVDTLTALVPYFDENERTEIVKTTLPTILEERSTSTRAEMAIRIIAHLDDLTKESVLPMPSGSLAP